jgi:hypothetical protein
VRDGDVGLSAQDLWQAAARRADLEDNEDSSIKVGRHAMQEMLPPRKRNNNEPSRRAQPTHMFAAPASADETPSKRKMGRPPLRQLTAAEKAQRLLESC